MSDTAEFFDARFSGHHHRLVISLLLPVMLVWLAGCASGVPVVIRDGIATSPGLAEVQAQPAQYLGQRVRWGGSILKVRNRSETTEIEVLAKPLDRFGEPNTEVGGIGRFIVEFAGFKDPSDYPLDRLLTVVGTITKVEVRPVGDFPYNYPVVASETQHLWPEPIPPQFYLAPYPFFSPWPGFAPGSWYW